jgi:hypothetical protein
MIKLIIFLVVVGFVAFWWLKKPRRYVEPLPAGDPKSQEFKSFWNRYKQNKRRQNIGCFGYIMFVMMAMLVYWLTTNYDIINVKAKAQPSATATPLITETTLPTPTVTATRTGVTVSPVGATGSSVPTATVVYPATATPRIIYSVVTVVVPQAYLITQVIDREVTRIVTTTPGPTQTPWIVIVTTTFTPTPTSTPTPTETLEEPGG